MRFACRVSVACLAPLLIAACGDRSPPPAPAADHRKPEAPSSIAVALEVPTAHRTRESSGVVVARLAERLVAFVADADDRAIRAFDATTLEALARTDLDGEPRDLLASVDGRLFVSLPERSELVTLVASGVRGELRESARTKTAIEPLGMALTPAEDRLLVVTGASHRVESFETATMARERSVDVAREPRAVLVTSDGKRAVVSHAIAGDASLITLDGGAAPVVERESLDLGDRLLLVNSGVLPRSARHATSIVRVQAKEDDKDVELLAFPLVQQAPWGGAPSGYGLDDTPITTPAPVRFYGCGYVRGDFVHDGRSSFDVRLLGPKSGKVRQRGPDRNVSHACLLPRAAIGLREKVLVACEGGSELVRIRFDRSGWPKHDGEIRVGRGPSAIARVPGAARAIVWAQLGRSLSLVALEEGAGEAATVTRAVERSRDRDATILAGREIFRRTGDAKISNDGIACASCHPDGRDDDLVWTGPHGKRRPPTLAGNVTRQGPFGWGGEHSTLESHMTQTVTRLGGKGLSTEELSSLAAYLRSLRPAPAVDAAALEADALAARGKGIFESDRAACATCHTQKEREPHDVGTGGLFVTPTLAGVGARRTLAHDGRFDSLESLLSSSPRMGGAAALGPADRAALVAYLRTL